MDLIGVSTALYRPSKTSSKQYLCASLPVAGLHLNWCSTHCPKSQVQNTNSGKSTYICMTFECSKITFSETARPPVSAVIDPGAVHSNSTFFSTLLQIFSTNSNIKATNLLKSHMHLTQYVDQVCIICGSVKVTLCPLTSSVDGVCTCTTPSTHISVNLVIVL